MGSTLLPDIVMMLVLSEVWVFFVAVIVTDVFPVPVTGLMVIQSLPSGTVMFQFVLEVMTIIAWLPFAASSDNVSLSVCRNIGVPACVTVRETERPPPEMVRVAVLGEKDGLS